MVFEDLNKSGYRSVPRTEGLDFNHMKVAFQKLANWHASTAVIVNVR